MTRVEKRCTRCGEFIPWRAGRKGGHEGANGMCSRCYRRGEVVQPIGRRPGSHVLEDWAELKSQGYTVRDAATRMGMTYQALAKAIERSARRSA